MTLKVDLKNKTLEDTDDLEVYDAKISEKYIAFKKDTWHEFEINRITGRFTRKVVSTSSAQEELEQTGFCSIKKPTYNKKF